jgi:very-long-chain (3R)-3-hydroxyacyl-CoA dehydratase
MSSSTSRSSRPKKEPSSLSRAYVIFYNVAQVLGWAFILFKLLQFYLDGNSHEKIVTKSLYEYLRGPLIIFQTAAILEVVHALTGLVRSPLMTTIMQVASRLVLVWGIVNVVPTAQNHPLLASMVGAWGVTEVIRYSYYALNIALGEAPYIVLWLRYTLFFVLYPLGVGSEIGLIYISLPWIRETGLFSLQMPNAWNFAFNYYYFLWLVILNYFPGFPTLYMHMIKQRARNLGTPQPPPKKA